MSMPGATNEAGNLASTCGTSISSGKVRASAESLTDTERAQQRRLELIFEGIAQGNEPSVADYNFASTHADIVTELLNKAPLNAGGGNVRAVLDFAASTAAYSPYRVLQASPPSRSRNAVLAALASEPQSQGVVHEWTRAWASGQVYIQAMEPAQGLATARDKASQPGPSTAAQGAVLNEVLAADTPPKPHAPYASPPPAANATRSDLGSHMAEGSAGGIAGAEGVATEAETDMAEAEAAAEVACQLAAHLTSASAAPAVAATPVSAAPMRPAFFQTLDAINGFQQAALTPGSMRDTASRVPARTPLPPIPRAPVFQHSAAPVMPTPPPPASQHHIAGSPAGAHGVSNHAALTPWHPPPHPGPQWAPTPGSEVPYLGFLASQEGTRIDPARGVWTAPVYTCAPGAMGGGWSPGYPPMFPGPDPGGYGAGGGFPHTPSGHGPHPPPPPPPPPPGGGGGGGGGPPPPGGGGGGGGGGGDDDSGGMSRGARAEGIPAPSFWRNPTPTRSTTWQIDDAALAGLSLAAWVDFVRKVWPRAPQAGVALGKQMKTVPDILAGIFRNIATDAPQYELRRNYILEVLARVFIHHLWASHDPSSPVPDAYTIETAHNECLFKLELGLSDMGASTFERLVLPLRDAKREPGARLLAFVETCDGHYIFSAVRSTERQRFKSVLPGADDTPLSFLTRAETMATARHLGTEDVVDRVRTVLQQEAPMLTVHMGSVNWNDLPSIRNFLECHEYGKHSFAALTDGKGAGPRAARSARVQEAFPTEGEGAPVDVDVSTYNRTTTRSGSSIEAYMPDANMQQFAALLRAMQGAPAAPAAPTTAVAQAPPPQLASSTTDIAREVARQVAAALGGVDRAKHFEALAASRVLLDINRIYPVLYPGKPIPPTKGVVGGLGWTGGAVICAACEVERPNVRNWLEFSDVERRGASDPTLLDGNGRPKLPPNSGWTHNAARCACLHRQVQKYVTEHPDCLWMITEPLP